MEWTFKDFFEIAMLVIGAVIYTLRQEARIDSLQAQIRNNKQQHDKLEEQVKEHKNKMDDKLDVMNDKMDELKDLIIQRTEK